VLLPFRSGFGLCAVRLVLVGACGEGERDRGRAAPDGDDGEAFLLPGTGGHSW
jgi:hypothetical protein